MDTIIRGRDKSFKVLDRHEVKLISDVLIPGTGENGFFIEWPNPLWKAENSNKKDVAYILLEKNGENRPSRKVRWSSNNRLDLCHYRVLGVKNEWFLERLQELKEEVASCDEDD